MDISRSCKIVDLNWGILSDFPARLQRLGITVESVSANARWYPDRFKYNSLEDISQDILKKGSPQSYDISIYGKFSRQPIRLHISRHFNVHGQEYLYIDADGIDSLESLSSMMEFLGLEPDEPTTLPPRPKRTAFIAHRFDSKGSECADKLARFLELLSFRVVTGREYSPQSLASKVENRIEQQAVIFLILTTGSDDTWLTQESIVGKIKGKPLIILKEKNADFKPGLLADHEYIPFEASNIELGFIAILEGLRELSYLEFE